MDDPNSFKPIPAPDSNHHFRVWLYGIAALLIIVIAFGAGYLFGLTSNSISTNEIVKQPSIIPSSSLQPNPTLGEAVIWTIGTGNSDMVEFSVTDSSGKTTGYNPTDQSYIQDLPKSTFVKEGGITDPSGQHPPMLDQFLFTENSPSQGIYTIKVFGKMDGKYHFGIGFENYPNSTAPKYIDGTAKANSVDMYTINIPTLAISKVN